MSSLRGQLIKCFRTLKPNTLKFCVEKNERIFCTAKKNIGIFQILTFGFIETFTNDVVSFEQPSPVLQNIPNFENECFQSKLRI